MDKQVKKRYPAVACCGIDCGLCPRSYTAGISKCPGCAGEDFFAKHPSCSIVTCCVKTNGWETCAECPRFPCEKLRDWDLVDSFVSHQRSLENLRQIQDQGIVGFAKQQKERIRLLNMLLKEYDDGKSKSFFCLAAALLEVDDLEEASAQIQGIWDPSKDRKQLAKLAKSILEQRAESKGVELVYKREKA
jgi:hypothetical protein